MSAWCRLLSSFQEYQRAVIFRLGRVKRGGAVGPGLFLIIPCIDTISVVDLRTVSFDVPPQEILTKVTLNILVCIGTRTKLFYSMTGIMESLLLILIHKYTFLSIKIDFT